MSLVNGKSLFPNFYSTLDIDGMDRAGILNKVK
jgi:hypothetical protein